MTRSAQTASMASRKGGYRGANVGMGTGPKRGLDGLRIPSARQETGRIVAICPACHNGKSSPCFTVTKRNAAAVSPPLLSGSALSVAVANAHQLAMLGPLVDLAAGPAREVVEEGAAPASPAAGNRQIGGIFARVSSRHRPPPGNDRRRFIHPFDRIHRMRGGLGGVSSASSWSSVGSGDSGSNSASLGSTAVSSAVNITAGSGSSSVGAAAATEARQEG